MPEGILLAAKMLLLHRSELATGLELISPENILAPGNYGFQVTVQSQL